MEKIEPKKGQILICTQTIAIRSDREEKNDVICFIKGKEYQVKEDGLVIDELEYDHYLDGDWFLERFIVKGEKKNIFTRKEVIALLKRQILASYHSYERFPVNMDLAKGFQASLYIEDLNENAKRLKKVNVVKF